MVVGDYTEHVVLLASNKDSIINCWSLSVDACCSARIGRAELMTINKLHFPVSRVPLHQMQNMSLDPKRRFALSGSSDEDPYSLTSGNGSSGSSARFNKQSAADKTPVLNKKERDFFVPQNWSATQDRKRDRSRDNFLDDEPEISTLKPRTNNRRRILKKTEDKKTIGECIVMAEKEIISLLPADDPYYCGFTARVPNFVKAGKQKTPASNTDKSQAAQPQTGGGQPQPSGRGGKYLQPGVLTPHTQTSQANNLAHIPQVQPFWWHSRLYPADVTTGGEC